MAKQLYIIRGTGLSLDGSVVVVTKREGDYCVVSPPNSQLNIQSTMIHEKCLQAFEHGNKRWSYQFVINKHDSDKGDCPPSDQTFFEIENCIRDVDLETIVEYLSTNLSPILRME